MYAVAIIYQGCNFLMWYKLSVKWTWLLILEAFIIIRNKFAVFVDWDWFYFDFVVVNRDNTEFCNIFSLIYLRSENNWLVLNTCLNQLSSLCNAKAKNASCKILNIYLFGPYLYFNILYTAVLLELRSVILKNM